MTDTNPQRRATKHDLIGSDGELRRAASTPAEQSRQAAAFTGKKSGAAFRPQHPEFHFTSSLYIDQAVEDLQAQVAQYNHIATGLVVVHLEIHRVDSDRARFRLAVQNNEFYSAVMDGTMQRWEGDRTRVDIDVKDTLATPVEFACGAASFYLFAVGFLAVLVLVRALLGVNISGNVRITPELQLVGAAGLFICLMLIFLHHLFGRTTRQQQITIVQTSPAHLSVLTTLLADVFRDHDMRWIENNPSARKSAR